MYLFATIKPWNLAAIARASAAFPGPVGVLSERAELTVERLRQMRPRYVFFPHWSWIVPEQILSEFECVCFHMTDVLHGRDGSRTPARWKPWRP